MGDNFLAIRQCPPGLKEDYDYEYLEFSHFLYQAEQVSGDYSDDEKCEICWRDLELKLLAHVGEDK